MAEPFIPRHEPWEHRTSNIELPTSNDDTECNPLDVRCWVLDVGCFFTGSGVQCANFSENSLPARCNSLVAPLRGERGQGDGPVTLETTSPQATEAGFVQPLKVDGACLTFFLCNYRVDKKRILSACVAEVTSARRKARPFSFVCGMLPKIGERTLLACFGRRPAE